MKAAIQLEEKEESATGTDGDPSAQLSNCVGESLSLLRLDDGINWRLQLARNPATAEEILEFLCYDRDENVCRAAIHTCWRLRMFTYI